VHVAVAGGTGTAGRYTLGALAAAGHEAVSLSRREGVDVVTGAGLASALAGAEVIVDATNTATRKRPAATAFFTGVTRQLQELGRQAGVRRLVLLSIVGAERVPYGYYQAKVAQEEAALQGLLPVSIVRATQFHELAGLLVRRARFGPVALAPRMVVQPIAAKAVGEMLAEVATAADPPERAEVAGPEREYFPDMAQALLHRLGARVMVLPFSLRGDAGPAVQGGALLPAEEVDKRGPTFAEWLEGDGPEAPFGS